MDVLLSERTKIIGKTWTPMNLGVLAVLALLLRAHVFPRFLRGSWMSWILVIKNINNLIFQRILIIFITKPLQLKNVRGEHRKFSCERKLTCDSVFGSDRVAFSWIKF